MKKILLLFSLLCANFIWSQTVSVIAPTNVEVGLNNNFQFRFYPMSSSLYTGYQVLSWQISSGISNMNNSGSPYYNDNSMSNTTMDMGSGSNVFIPIGGKTTRTVQQMLFI